MSTQAFGGTHGSSRIVMPSTTKLVGVVALA
jgi:hypothetical protein